MATWKKVAVSGSDISQFNNDAGYLTSVTAQHAFVTASFNGTNLLADSSQGQLNFASGSGQGLSISANAGTDTLTFGLSSIPNTSLANDGITIAGQDTSLGGTITADTIAGQISSGIITNAQLENDSIQFGSDNISLGSTVSQLNITGYTGSFTGSFTGDGSGLTGVRSHTPFITGSVSTGILPAAGNNCTTIGSFSTIAGGTLNTASIACSFIGGGASNSITGCNINSIVGGQDNTISGGYNGFIGAGCDNTLSAGYGCDNSIVGGFNNEITAGCGADANSIVGGGNNTISGDYTSYSGILGGLNNTIEGDVTTNTTIVGGQLNVLSGSCSGILGGNKNLLDGHANSFIIGSNLTSSADCYTFMNNLDVEGTISGSTISGSFVGDGSGLTGVSNANALTDGNGITDFTYNGGTAGITVSVQADSTTGGDTVPVSVSANGVGLDLTSIDGTGIGTSGAGELELDLAAVITGDAANRVLTSDGDGTLTAEANFTFDGSTLTVTGDQIVTGDLTVQGTASFQNTEELQVADRFVLFASGSNTAGDGGIVVQQGTQNIGELFAYDSATTRWGLTSSFDASDTAYTPDAFMAAVIEGTDDNPDNVPERYDKKGNIFVGTTEGEIWIYG